MVVDGEVMPREKGGEGGGGGSSCGRSVSAADSPWVRPKHACGPGVLWPTNVCGQTALRPNKACGPLTPKPHPSLSLSGSPFSLLPVTARTAQHAPGPRIRIESCPAERDSLGRIAATPPPSVPPAAPPPRSRHASHHTGSFSPPLVTSRARVFLRSLSRAMAEAYIPGVPPGRVQRRYVGRKPASAPPPCCSSGERRGGG